MAYKSSCVLLGSICYYFVEAFCVCTHKRSGSVVLALSNALGSIFSACFFLGVGGGFEKDWWQFFIWWNSLVKPSGSGLLFVGNVLIPSWVSLLLIGIILLSISSWGSFVISYLLRNFSILSKLSNLLAYSLQFSSSWSISFRSYISAYLLVNYLCICLSGYIVFVFCHSFKR